eukprot:c2948_g1_i1.p1 GENE.c2948_g1_i1~~c2948_g1_i1.p1  ORF type:complete len:267 (-),score=-30.10 c2948_g1_i1:167-967(-)
MGNSDTTLTQFWMMDKYLPSEIESLVAENNENHDLMLHPYKQIGKQSYIGRIMLFFSYALFHYDFQYIFRIDDDNFICLDRLQKELEHRPKKYYYAGHFHCYSAFYRADESAILLSRDLALFVVEMHSRYDLRMGPLAGMVVGGWLSILDTILFNDLRMLQSVRWGFPVEAVPGGVPEEVCNVKILTRHKTDDAQAQRIYAAGVKESYDIPHLSLQRYNRTVWNCVRNPHMPNIPPMSVVGKEGKKMCLLRVKFSRTGRRDEVNMY